MTAPRPTDHTRGIMRRLRRLPNLAAQAHTPRDTQPGENLRHAAPGPRLPAGVAEILDTLDAGREFPHLLDRVSGCIRTVLEELGHHNLPDPGPGEKRTWASECRWLTITAQHWAVDPWCVEWIDTETAHLERTLSDRIHSNTGRCAFCGSPLETQQTGPLASVICPRCDRVVSMRLTTSPDKADAWTKARQAAGAQQLAARLRRDTPPHLPGDA